MRRRRPDLPVLFMTGAPLEESSAADGLLSKRMLLRKPSIQDSSWRSCVRIWKLPARRRKAFRPGTFLRRARAKLETFLLRPSSHLTLQGDGGEIQVFVGFLLARACLLQI